MFYLSFYMFDFLVFVFFMFLFLFLTFHFVYVCDLYLFYSGSVGSHPVGFGPCSEARFPLCLLFVGSKLHERLYILLVEKSIVR